MKANDLAAKFRHPPAEFLPMPWLAWNGDLTPTEVDCQLDEFKRSGVHEFVLFPCSGLTVPYLSPEYWQRVRALLEGCRDRSLRMWIHDEYNSPSGTAAGQVLQDHPWAASTGLDYTIVDAQPGQEVRVTVHGEPLCAVFMRGESEALPVSDFAWEAPSGGDHALPRGGHATMRWRNAALSVGRLIVLSLRPARVTAGTSTHGALWSNAQPGGLDTLRADAVKVFLDYTYQAYADRFAEFIPRTLCGFFTDDPEVHSDKLPWTPKLPDLFHERFGYELLPRLHELVLDVEYTGAERAANVAVANPAPSFFRTRRDFWSLVTSLFAESYFDQLNTWCQQRGLKLAGGPRAGDSLRLELTRTGDRFELTRKGLLPAFTLPREDGEGLADLVPLLQASGARWSEVSRVMATLDDGGLRWRQSPSTMKNTANRAFARGADAIAVRSLPHSLEDIRKWAHSGMTRASPAWQCFDQLSQYCARLGWLQASGASGAEIVVLWPTTASWCLLNSEILSDAYTTGAHADDTPAQRAWRGMEDAVVAVAGALRSHQWPFDFIFERALLECRLHNGALAHPHGGEIRCVILPATCLLGKKVFQKLKAFGESGGFLLAVDPIPRLSPDAGWNVESEVRELFRSPNAVVLPPIADDEAFAEILDTTLLPRIGRPFFISGAGAESLVVTHRRCDDAETILIANLASKPSSPHIEIGAPMPLEVWHPETGEQHRLETETDGERQSFVYEFEANETICIIGRAQPSAALPPLPRPGGHLKSEIALPSQWRFRTEEPNQLTLKLAVRVDPRDEGIAQQWFLRASEPSAEWRAAVQLDPALCKAYWLRGAFSLEDDFADCWLAVDSRLFENVWINGWAAEEWQSRKLWDAANRAVRLDGLTRRGLNTVVIRARPSPYFAERVRGHSIDPACVEPVVVTGRFTVIDRGGVQTLGPERRLLRVGDSWNRQGLPHFFGTGVYEQTLTLSAESAKSRATLELGNAADSVAVFVNDQHVATRCWRPYRVDVSGRLRAGENRLSLKVSNNLGNLFRHPSEAESDYGLLSPVILRFYEEGRT